MNARIGSKFEEAKHPRRKGQFAAKGLAQPGGTGPRRAGKAPPRRFPGQGGITAPAGGKTGQKRPPKAFKQGPTGPEPERSPRRARKSSKDPNAKILYSTEQLIEVALSAKSAKDWYDECEGTISGLFGQNTGMFKKFLAATSMATSVPGNVTLALKAYRQWVAGEPFSGFLPAVIKNLNRIVAQESLSGPKVSEYGKAMSGDDEGLAVDRHIFQLMFHTTGTKPTPAQVEQAKDKMMGVAKSLGWKPKQIQAAIWAAHIIRTGETPETYHHRLLEKKAKGELDDIIQKRTTES